MWNISIQILKRGGWDKSDTWNTRLLSRHVGPYRPISYYLHSIHLETIVETSILCDSLKNVFYSHFSPILLCQKADIHVILWLLKSCDQDEKLQTLNENLILTKLGLNNLIKLQQWLNLRIPILNLETLELQLLSRCNARPSVKTDSSCWR